MGLEDMRVDLPLFDEVENGSVTVPTGDEKPVLTYLGEASAWDVWVEAPATWRAASVELRVYVRLGTQSALIKTVKFSEAPGLVGSMINTILCSVRGRPCTSIELRVYQTTGGTLTGGKLRMQTWTGGEVPVTSSPARWDATTIRGLGSSGNVVIEPVGGVLNVNVANQLGTSTNPVHVRPFRRGASLSATTSVIAIPATDGARKTLGVLWSAKSRGRDAELVRVSVSFLGDATGVVSFHMSSFTAEDAGSSPRTPVPWDSEVGVPSDSCEVYDTMTGLTNVDNVGDLFASVLPAPPSATILWDAAATGQELMLRSDDSGEGLEIWSLNETGLGKATSAIVTFHWIELGV